MSRLWGYILLFSGLWLKKLELRESNLFAQSPAASWKLSCVSWVPALVLTAASSWEPTADLKIAVASEWALRLSLYLSKLDNLNAS